VSVYGIDPTSSDAGPSIDPLEKPTKCPRQLMVVVVVLAAAANAKTEQLPEDEDPVVVPLEAVGEGVQVTGMVGAVLRGNVGRRRWLLSWRHRLLIWTRVW
jgi:hypothetical protein